MTISQHQTVKTANKTLGDYDLLPNQLLITMDLKLSRNMNVIRQKDL